MPMSFRHARALRSLLLLLAAACGSSRESQAQDASRSPRLVVFITVDQMRADYFDRFGPQLTGGLKRIHDGGAVFTEGYQDHAITETAAGHASTMSGRFPQHTGIVKNSMGVSDPQSPLLTSRDWGASPFRFRGSALIDWMRLADPRSRALSISRKDRGAILPLGRAKQPAFWFATSTAEFTTSTYYADTLPAWIREVNARRVPQRAAGTAWRPLLEPSAYPERDSVALENGGSDFVFPHVLPDDSTKIGDEFVATPWMDALTLDAALAGLNALRLGQGPAPDLLAISLSATDYVGHRYGMDSKELHDQILRLDRSLGAFLDSLYRIRDSSSVIIALTADHGMTPYPDIHFPGTDPMRGRSDPGPTLAAFRTTLMQRGVDSSAMQFESGLVTFDSGAFVRAGVNRDSAARALAAALRRVPGVLQVDVRPGLAARAAAGNVYARRWMHTIPADLPAVAMVTLRPYYYWASTRYPTHGSPHDSDAHVPIIFYGAPFARGRYTRFVRVVDMGPTLAAVLHVSPTEPLDGRVLREALAGQRPAVRR
jgi:predicted AlkP superfamily pyrophosphatase or phosphodiesterase